MCIYIYFFARSRPERLSLSLSLFLFLTLARSLLPLPFGSWRAARAKTQNGGRAPLWNVTSARGSKHSRGLDYKRLSYYTGSALG